MADADGWTSVKSTRKGGHGAGRGRRGRQSRRGRPWSRGRGRRAVRSSGSDKPSEDNRDSAPRVSEPQPTSPKLSADTPSWVPGQPYKRQKKVEPAVGTREPKPSAPSTTKAAAPATSAFVIKNKSAHIQFEGKYAISETRNIITRTVRASARRAGRAASRIVFLGGVPGAGKSTVAQTLRTRGRLGAQKEKNTIHTRVDWSTTFRMHVRRYSREREGIPVDSEKRPSVWRANETALLEFLVRMALGGPVDITSSASVDGGKEPGTGRVLIIDGFLKSSKSAITMQCLADSLAEKGTLVYMATLNVSEDEAVRRQLARGSEATSDSVIKETDLDESAARTRFKRLRGSQKAIQDRVERDAQRFGATVAFKSFSAQGQSANDVAAAIEGWVAATKPQQAKPLSSSGSAPSTSGDGKAKPKTNRDLRTAILRWARGNASSASHNSCPGPMPVALLRKTALRISRLAYWVCEKSDGERKMLYYNDAERKFYFVGRKFELEPLPAMHGLRDAVFAGGDALIDGELVKEFVDSTFDASTLKCETRTVYWVFDVVAWRGKSFAKQVLSRRLDQARALCAAWQGAAAQGPFEAQMKQFVHAHDLSDIWAQVDRENGYSGGKAPDKAPGFWYRWRASDGSQCRHANDGLVFTPQQGGYLGKIYKWKPMDLATIDVEIYTDDLARRGAKSVPVFVTSRVNQSRGGGGGGGRPCSVYLRDIPMPSHSEALLREARQNARARRRGDRQLPKSVIAEIGYDFPTGKWAVHRLRHDKARPNFITTCTSTFDAMFDGLTPEILSDMLRDRRDDP